MNEQTNHYERFFERYDTDRVPWGDPLPPPEVQSLAAAMPPGRALDLGCGFGRVAIYLAQRGWSVDGIDFIPKAIEVARRRAEEAGVATLARFHVASAADLGFLTAPYDLAVDIGCMHSFGEELLRGYRHELVRLLRSGGRYVLFAHLRDDNDPVEEDGPRGIPESTISSLLRHDFRLERVEHGVTQVEDRPPWNSAWFWYQRH